ncbi:tRNA (adenine(37)-N6)-methyltransferase-like [Oppia nitens]|uniref:tRNA (adenine(37)-N6)-methyltransferase-like n=1 Tax=Oppia nitens TaxID=1686743 RepID=UPI0023DA2FB1|nr:tRNA (adenine(37)-N6)-methyltransferase-like [Oppia nitens]
MDNMANSCSSAQPTRLDQCLQAIGFMESVFNKKNGTPRQSAICPQSKGCIDLNKCLFNNPMHSLIGIQDFTHIWVLYYFHMNTNKRCPSKVRPPRLNGQSCGVFASRSPHRPNPIGLSLVKLEDVRDGKLYVSGIDLLDGTPILDIKPYIKQYDSPDCLPMPANIDRCLTSSETSSDSISGDLESLVVLNNDNEVTTQRVSNELQQFDNNSLPNDWIDGSVVSEVSVEFTEKSLKQLQNFHTRVEKNLCDYCLKYLKPIELRDAITNLLRADPRSVYRRNKCVDRLYYFTIDSIHITSWFDIETNVVEVIKVKPFMTKQLSNVD